MKTPASYIGASAFFRFGIKGLQLAGHRRAAFLAFPAAFDALVHVANFLATVGAGLADCCTGFAVVGVVVAVAAHEADAGIARGDAVEHQFDVRLFDVVTAFGQACGRQHVAEHRLTFLAVLDAVLFGCGGGCHSLILRFVDGLGHRDLTEGNASCIPSWGILMNDNLTAWRLHGSFRTPHDIFARF